ncbi:hypothetical protein H2199_004973 [Coniosporium tulheliwenetii]|uniref:Uncharacterized protein n=1 Tax=Coniosporium tulheliwenetii TaxID=3383036 RepID=A0ACC2Z4D6_9PEZI|nr:hypothetical protein H2199_004973 [Cladosporium sp. JES 115]
MAVYLAYVRPFYEHLMVQVQGGGWSDHVWAETDRLTSVIARETASRLRERLTTLGYRHVAISIGRVSVGEQFASGYREEIGEVEEAEVEVEDALELSAARGEKMGVQRYGVPSDIIKHLSVRSMETFGPLSEPDCKTGTLLDKKPDKPEFYHLFSRLDRGSSDVFGVGSHWGLNHGDGVLPDYIKYIGSLQCNIISG